MTTPASAKQVAFATTLGKELAALVGQNEARALAVQEHRDDWAIYLADRRAMTEALNVMLATKRNWVAQDRAAGKAQAAPAVEVPEGVHKVDGTIYKVQRAVHGSGHLYAKVLKVYDAGCALCGGDHGCTQHEAGDRFTTEWEYAQGAMRLLSADTAISAEEAAKFGHLYGQCVFCSRTLTDERSIEVGYGPVCADHHALPWGAAVAA